MASIIEENEILSDVTDEEQEAVIERTSLNDKLRWQHFFSYGSRNYYGPLEYFFKIKNWGDCKIDKKWNDITDCIVDATQILKGYMKREPYNVPISYLPGKFRMIASVLSKYINDLIEIVPKVFLDDVLYQPPYIYSKFSQATTDMFYPLFKKLTIKVLHCRYEYSNFAFMRWTNRKSRVCFNELVDMYRYCLNVQLLLIFFCYANEYTTYVDKYNVYGHYFILKMYKIQRKLNVGHSTL